MNKNITSDTSINATSNYSLHTITLRIKLQEGFNDLIRISLDELCKEQYPQRKYKIENNNLCKYYFDLARLYGFNSIKLVEVHTKNLLRPKYYLDIKINPWRLFHSDTYPFIYIATMDDLIKSYQLVQTLLQDLKLPETLIKRFYLKRVDFCTNISLGSTDAVDEYMKILHYGTYPYSFNRLLEYSPTQKRWIPTKNSFTVGSKEIQFSLYNKYKQLKAEHNKYNFNEIEAAKGKIRIELRIDRSAIKRKENKYKIADSLEFIQLAADMASIDFPRYLKMIYGSGKFVTYKEAKKIIDNTNHRQQTKDLLLQTLSAVKENRSLQLIKEELGTTDYSKCIRLFNNIGISPITIDKRATIKEFEHPIYYINNCNCNHPD